MKTIPLKFRFKGNRDYVHGTDVYNQTMDEIKAQCNCNELKALKFAIHHIASRHCDLLLGDAGEVLKKPDDIFVDLFINTDKGNLFAFLVETNKAVKDRYEYDENRIGVLCKIIGEKIIISGKSGYSSIETAVSMTKKLHYELFQVKHGKWFFTRLELKRLLENADSGKLAIVFKHNLDNRFTKSEIFSGKECIGHIYFSLVKR